MDGFLVIVSCGKGRRRVDPIYAGKASPTSCQRCKIGETLEIPDSIVSAAERLDRNSFAKARDKWIRPSYDLTGLKYLRLQAARERDIRELYRNRAPYELLQNADDVGATQAIFVLVGPDPIQWTVSLC